MSCLVSWNWFRNRPFLLQWSTTKITIFHNTFWIYFQSSSWNNTELSTNIPFRTNNHSNSSRDRIFQSRHGIFSISRPRSSAFCYRTLVFLESNTPVRVNCLSSIPEEPLSFHLFSVFAKTRRTLQFSRSRLFANCYRVASHYFEKVIVFLDYRFTN